MRRARWVTVTAGLAFSWGWVACKDSSPPPAAPIVTMRMEAGADAAEDAKADGLARSMADLDAAIKEAQAAQPDFYSCASDSECVAVPRNGCCFNGFMEAVNKNQVQAYKASFVCPHPNQMCPHYRVEDKRVPECNVDHHCEMVRAEDIKCGPTHACPEGFACKGGACVK